MKAPCEGERGRRSKGKDARGSSGGWEGSSGGAAGPALYRRGSLCREGERIEEEDRINKRRSSRRVPSNRKLLAPKGRRSRGRASTSVARNLPRHTTQTRKRTRTSNGVGATSKVVLLPSSRRDGTQSRRVRSSSGEKRAAVRSIDGVIGEKTSKLLPSLTSSTETPVRRAQVVRVSSVRSSRADVTEAEVRTYFSPRLCTGRQERTAPPCVVRIVVVVPPVSVTVATASLCPRARTDNEGRFAGRRGRRIGRLRYGRWRHDEVDEESGVERVRSRREMKAKEQRRWA